jgi:hypothetical protein
LASTVVRLLTVVPLAKLPLILAPLPVKKAMMLEHLGEHEAARKILSGIERVLAERTLRTRDLGAMPILWPAARRLRMR